MKTGAIEAKGDLRYLGLLLYRLYNSIQWIAHCLGCKIYFAFNAVQDIVHTFSSIICALDL